jgi:hypothetical protein
VMVVTLAFMGIKLRGYDPHFIFLLGVEKQL